MRARMLILICLFLSSDSFAGLPCHLTQQFGNPKLANDAKFWQELGPLAERGDVKGVAALLSRRGIETRAAAAPVQLERRVASVSSANAFRMNHTAQKELSKLQPNLRDRANNFLGMAKNGRSALYAELRKNPGSWEFKKLKGSEGFSVRLDGGYRLKWVEKPGDSIEIVNLNKTATHGGH